MTIRCPRPGKSSSMRRPRTLPKQLRQPRHVDGDAPSLVFREYLRLPRLDLGLAAVDVSGRLSTGVTDDVAAGYRVGDPGRGEGA
jgi:hypothetical protein